MDLKKRLEYHYTAFDKTKISPDPLQFPHIFKNEKDIEVMAFILALFAYGNVSQIIKTLNKILSIFKNHPYDFIINFNPQKQISLFNDIKHRFYRSGDIIKLFKILSSILQEYDGLKKLFLNWYKDDHEDVKISLSNFSQFIQKKYFDLNEGRSISNGFKFMFPDPAKGSACKRLNLFLRWMVRKDELDFGIWNEISTSKLIIPVDTHIARICKELSLTKRKNVSWQMAKEITENLKKFDPLDPVKYDFAISHIGIRKLHF